MSSFKIRGLCAATHTPFTAEGDLHLAVVEKQAAHLAARGVKSVFIGGTTGESHSTSTAERKALAERWVEVTKVNKFDLPVIVHVGSNCLTDAAELAAHAQKIGAASTSMLAPSYFKPTNVDTLVECCAKVAKAAPDLPFYFYDIPVLTGVNLNAEEFLSKAPAKIPNFAGIKFTNPDFLQFQLCHRFEDGRFDIPYGNDEYFLGAHAMGARGAVGSTFNFAPGVYQRMMKAAESGDMKTAADEQFRSVQLVKVVAKHGYMGCAKALMGHLGVPVGPARLPMGNPSPEAVKAMLGELEAIGFFEWKD
jgi:N-acetylneuraminate lyase